MCDMQSQKLRNLEKILVQKSVNVMPRVSRLMSCTIFVGPEMIQEMDELMQSIRMYERGQRPT